ncbi:hypothetical protein F511_26772 [Dorcoceras hygrometricum]|uniref:Uncharacterized protein n=1 Tax=Dorcoceras hygrometricum TaxID=472368 RepID=A0A2Z7BYZ0_9LAMI|nr:hypothetical protein F511_26772 [Dorcoceras hygrometricum]
MEGFFSMTGVPFKTLSKNRDIKVEYKLLNDIVAKSLMAKRRDKGELGTSIFETLAAIVSTPGKKSLGYEVKLSLLLEKLVKADLGESVALHPLKVLNTKSVHTYKLKNQASIPKTEGGKKQAGDKVDRDVEPMKKKQQKKKQAAKGSQASVQNRCPEIQTKGDLSPSDSESTASLDLLVLKKKLRKHRSRKPKPTSAIQDEAAQTSISEDTYEDAATAQQVETSSAVGDPATKTIEIQEMNWITHFLSNIDPVAKGKGVLVALYRPNLVEEHCAEVIKDIHEQLVVDACVKVIEFCLSVGISSWKDVSSSSRNQPLSDRVSCWYFIRCVLVGSSSNADVDFQRWCISAYPAVSRDQLLRVISCWYFSCDDQQRALRDFEATTFCE